ncbi:hypothetical protein ABL840_00535 [Variovorax sp. NFACC27]|uniref:hypothetical protein n=1 Tax=unclassified Variovorax TaxID=663243 RepID=UPI00089C6DC5|nr:hypothetical protein SAMN03159371_01314 [Variovorax sp. NFACC28]SEF91785.1 hypothetical protein SAMN03159365_00927 [Variovorax sp. NFACC29]SFB89818.1 hypothetical protein SAMN03159379_00926 [Variovorax sp. NFACC26]SFF83957.1 hypothetical protein SAMN03159447_00497 [Variovorax sp. NFACC27]
MASPESIHQLLTVAARLLDSAASEIRDAKLEPVRENIGQIGEILARIFEIEQQIYLLRPELKPAYLNSPSPYPESNRLLTRFMFEACQLEDAGEFGRAIEKYEEYLLLEESTHHREIAEAEIRRLSEKNDD